MNGRFRDQGLSGGMSGDSLVYALATHGDAALRTTVRVRDLTMIARDVASGSAFLSRLARYTNRPSFEP